MRVFVQARMRGKADEMREFILLVCQVLKHHGDSQTIVISPLSLSVIPLGEGVKKIQLKAIDRNQGSFFRCHSGRQRRVGSGQLEAAVEVEGTVEEEEALSKANAVNGGYAECDRATAVRD
jgi:hypothetical protein